MTRLTTCSVSQIPSSVDNENCWIASEMVTKSFLNSYEDWAFQVFLNAWMIFMPHDYCDQFMTDQLWWIDLYNNYPVTRRQDKIWLQ